MMTHNVVTYPAVFKRDPDTRRLTIIFPDVPGAISEAASMNSASANAAAALGLILYDAPSLPASTPLAEVQRAYPGETVQLITADLAEVVRTVTNLA